MDKKIYQSTDAITRSILNQNIIRIEGDTEEITELDTIPLEINPFGMSIDISTVVGMKIKDNLAKTLDSFSCYDLLIFTDVCTLIERKIQELGYKDYYEYINDPEPKIIKFTLTDVASIRNTDRRKDFRLDLIATSLERLKNINIWIDCEEEFNIRTENNKMKAPDNGSGFKKFEPFLFFGLYEQVTNTPIKTKDNVGNTSYNFVHKGYYLEKLPPLYRYAKNSGQSTFLSDNLFGTPETIRISRIYENVQFYLNNQINLIKTKRRDNPTIKFSSLYEYLGEIKENYAVDINKIELTKAEIKNFSKKLDLDMDNLLEENMIALRDYKADLVMDKNFQRHLKNIRDNAYTHLNYLRSQKIIKDYTVNYEKLANNQKRECSVTIKF